MDCYENWTLSRIAVIGAGAMGASLAAILGAEIPTILVCRNPRRAADLFEHGARVQGALKAEARPIIVASVADLPRVGGVSVVFVATKTTAIPSVARDLKPLLAEAADQPHGLFVISYQNGIDPGRQLMDLLDWPQVLRMVLNFGAVLRSGDHAVDVTLNRPPHAIGALDPVYRPVCERIAGALTRAGFETRVDPDIEPRVWAKAIVNAAMNPVAALLDATVAEVMRSPSRMIVERLLREGVDVATAENLDLGHDYLTRAHEILDSAGEHTPSMVEDIRSGRESEVGQLNRQILERARARSIDTPTHEIVDAFIETFDWRIYERRQRPGD